jgi:hypothetical protein
MNRLGASFNKEGVSLTDSGDGQEVMRCSVLSTLCSDTVTHEPFRFRKERPIHLNCYYTILDPTNRDYSIDSHKSWIVSHKSLKSRFAIPRLFSPSSG